MKKLLTITAAALLAAAPAHAGTKERFEAAIEECLSYPSKMNCDKAKGAASLYLNIKKSILSEECFLLVRSASVMADTVPLIGHSSSVYRTYEIYQNKCGA